MLGNGTPNWGFLLAPHRPAKSGTGGAGFFPEFSTG